MVTIETCRAPLFVPANRPDRFEKAAASGADAVILDLEDAVARDEKDAARAALRCDFTDLPVIVRINPVGAPWHAADLAAVRALPVAGVMLPKAESPAQIAEVCQALAGQSLAGHTLAGQTPILALIETARGVAEARAIAALKSVARLVFGSIDYCVDLGCAHQREILLLARMELVLAAKLSGLAPPIDGVTTRLDHLKDTYEDALHARDLGMTGKLCIHPRQTAEIYRAFAPTPSEVDWARRVLASGDGVASIDGMMIDEPVRKRAQTILNQVGSGDAAPPAN